MKNKQALKAKALINLLEKYTGKKVKLVEEPVVPMQPQKAAIAPKEAGVLGPLQLTNWKMAQGGGDVILNGKKISTYAFDRDSDCFWTHISSTPGDIGFDDLKDLYTIFKRKGLIK